MPTNTKEKSSDRVGIISAVKTYLGFFVLIVLVVEVSLGALALRAEPQNQLIAIAGMILVFLGLISVVSFFAYRKPDALLRSVASQQQLQEFGSRISGYWWERITPDEPCALSFVEISPDPATSTVKLKGSAYSREGVLAANWETVASCINLSERKVFYYWKGMHPSHPNEPYEGFGEISFHEPVGQISSGVGFFSDTNVTDMRSTTRMSTEFWRSEEREEQVLRGHNSKLISELIQKKLNSMN